MTASLAQTLLEMLGIYESCPKNIRFLIKNLIKVGFQKNSRINVRLNLKIRNMLGYPKVPVKTSKNQVTTHNTPTLPAIAFVLGSCRDDFGVFYRTCHFYLSLPYPILSYYAMVLASLLMLLALDGLLVRYTNNLP